MDNDGGKPSSFRPTTVPLRTELALLILASISLGVTIGAFFAW